MDFQKFLIDQIVPDPLNPRVELEPNDKEYKEIEASIKEYGLVQPFIINKRSGFLISGHQRLKIAKRLGYTEVEVVVVDLSPREQRKLNLAMNKISGRWDELKLSNVLEELYKELDSDLESTGFSLPEISEIMDAKRELEEDDFDLDATLESIETPITQPGDLIKLGSHRLLCGDSSKLEDIKRLMENETAQALVTDPPYNVDYYGGNRPIAEGRPKPSKQWERIYADNKPQSEYVEWFGDILNLAIEFLAPGSCCYIWNGHKQFGPMHQMLVALGFHISCVITWAKPSFAIGYGDYNMQTEFCLYAWKTDAAHRWFGPTNESTLWEIKRDPTKSYIHPTQKPLALAQRAIRNSTLQNEIVLDLFLGSGSTLCAAETLDRRCFGIEIDPKYCDAIVRRYIALIGKEKVSLELRERYMKEETKNV